LARLKARDLKKCHPDQPSKSSKPSNEGFEGDRGMPFLKNQALTCLQCGGGPLKHSGLSGTDNNSPRRRRSRRLGLNVSPDGPPMRRRRQLPPGSPHHEFWCGIFEGRACDCDDDWGERRRPRPRPLPPDGVSPKKREEMEEA